MPHTPGTWELVTLDAPLDDWTAARYVIREPKHAPGGIAVIIGGAGGIDDAHLLKTAPKLLGVAKGYMRYLETHPSDDLTEPLLQAVREIIAEAEGVKGQ